jgi:hypothetical protein
MLRASIEYYGRDADVRVITEGAKLGDAGIPHGERLATFAEAAVKGDAAELATARDALRDAAGSAALVDAAAVVGNFERMVRIADGTGIPVDSVMSTLVDAVRGHAGGPRTGRIPDPPGRVRGGGRPRHGSAASDRSPHGAPDRREGKPAARLAADPDLPGHEVES